MKKLLVAVIFVCMVGVSYAADNFSFYPVTDEKGVILISQHWVVPDKKKATDGYLEVTTKSGAVYKIYPCGLVEKLTWKEVAPNIEQGLITWGTINGDSTYDLRSTR
jgi:hypothetical protein